MLWSELLQDGSMELSWEIFRQVLMTAQNRMPANRTETLTSNINRLHHIHPLRFGQCYQNTFLPSHQLHCDDITDCILTCCHSYNTAMQGRG